MARTLALARVHGVLLRALDADDLLPEGALARDIETLTTHRELGWCVSACLDLLPDGTLTPGPHDPPAGPLPPGVLAQGLKEGKLQVMGTTLTAYTDLVRAVGGWMALPSEDVALLVTCEAVAKGWFIDQPGEIYRKWSGQQSANPDLHKQLSNRTHHEVLVARADALRRAGWRWHPDTPEREVRPIPTRPGQAPP